MRRPGPHAPDVRTGPGAGRGGYVHETAFYGSDDELLSIVVPFLLGGVEAGEPALAAFGPAHDRLVRAALPDDAPITFLPAADRYSRPAATLRSYQQVLAAYVAGGAHQVRIAGDVPHPGTDARWDPWARYEAAANRALAAYPLWGLCPYDTRTTPDEVLEDVRRAHPRIATADGRHLVNDDHLGPAEFLRQRPPPPPDPVEATAPDLELVGPTPAAARAATGRLGRATTLASDAVHDLVVAVSEVVSNAHAYGRPPVVVRAWAEPARLVVTVHDRGPGPDDPLVGLEAGRGAVGGFGLWLAHQLVDELDLRRDADGFTVRLAARGRPQRAAGRTPNQR